MLRERARLLVQIHKVWDIGLTAGAFIGAYFIKRDLLFEPFRGLSMDPNYYIVLLMIIIIWYVTFSLFDLYASYRKRSLPEIFGNMLKAVSTAMLILFLGMFLFKVTDVSRIMMGLFFLLHSTLLALSKGIIYAVLLHYRKQGFNFRNILMVGSKERAKDFIETLWNHSGSGYRVLGCLELHKAAVGRTVINGVTVIGTIDDMEKILWEQVVDEVVFAMPLERIGHASHYMTIAEEMGVVVRIVPECQIKKIRYMPKIAAPHFAEFLGLPTMELSTTTTMTGALLIKSIFDFTVAVFGILLSLPLFLIIACAIKLSSRGPIFFKQERSGLNGRTFMVYKFRTMVADAEAHRKELDALNETDGPVFKIKKDPRIIPFVGTLLRKTSLDELPQLLNILRGEMSLVGPRPPIPAEVEQYDVWQRRRLSMKPGLTCLWQVAPHRNDISFEEWMRMDLEYIDNWFIWLDFKILLKTARAVFIAAGR